jgi:hypothetical protein
MKPINEHLSHAAGSALLLALIRLHEWCNFEIARRNRHDAA